MSEFVISPPQTKPFIIYTLTVPTSIVWTGKWMVLHSFSFFSSSLNTDLPLFNSIFFFVCWVAVAYTCCFPKARGRQTDWPLLPWLLLMTDILMCVLLLFISICMGHTYTRFYTQVYTIATHICQTMWIGCDKTHKQERQWLCISRTRLNS